MLDGYRQRNNICARRIGEKYVGPDTAVGAVGLLESRW